ncbi:hypothetical protein [Buttiauxella izardii]|nr:hypothetical protein [Buttiauxella izardii]
MLTAQEPIVIPAPPEEPEIMKILRKACNLPRRKQIHVTDYVEMIIEK